MKTLSILVLVFGIFAAHSSWATLAFVNPTVESTGASNVVVPGASHVASTASFYYSNISAQMHPNPATGVLDYYGDGVTQCSTALNPFCRQPSDLLSLNVISSATTSNTPIMYLLYCAGSAPVQGAPISSCTILAQQYYADGFNVPTMSVAWRAICSAASASGSDTTSNLQSNCIDSLDGVDEVTLYLVADPTGEGLISTETMAFSVYFDSSIPAYASSAPNAINGLYDFQTFASDHKVVIVRPMTDSTFPATENVVGIQSVRFLYYQSASSAFDVNQFGQIPSLPAAAQFPSFTFALTRNGALSDGVISPLTNGVRYYFQAALVDYAGNVGYQTMNQQSESQTAVPQQ